MKKAGLGTKEMVYICKLLYETFCLHIIALHFGTYCHSLH